jgi:hypothetical protein
MPAWESIPAAQRPFQLQLMEIYAGFVEHVDVQAGKVIAGVRYTYADALHGTGGPGDLPTHRVGPLFAYTFHDRPAGTRFNRPTLLALVQWHAQHPWRAGARQTAAYPLIALALQFDGDLWIGRR